jgi:hypothetical protein
VSDVDGGVGGSGSGAGAADGSGGASAGSVMAGATTAAGAGGFDPALEVDRPTGVGPAAGFAVPAGCAAAVVVPVVPGAGDVAVAP